MKPILPIVFACLLTVTCLPTSEAATTYTQSVWFNWNHKDLDILVLNPQDPVVGAAIQRGMNIWMNSLNSMWPGHGITFRVVYEGQVVPTDFRPDIVWVPQGFAAVRPILTNTPCYVTAPMAVGWGSFVRVTSHEFGHCLGLTHVFDNGVEYKPSQDIMGDGDGNKCASNLNIQVLQRAFGGQGGTVSMSSTSYSQTTGC
jgi:gametolysin peptidase M11